MNDNTAKTLSDIIADSLEQNPVTVADDFHPEVVETFDATKTIAQLRKPSVKVLDATDDETRDLAAIEVALAELDGRSTRVKVAIVEAVIERVTRLSIAEGRMKDVHQLDVGNSYAWAAWAAVLTGTGLAWSPDNEGEIVTATLDHVVDAIVGETVVYFTTESGVFAF